MLFFSVILLILFFILAVPFTKFIYPIKYNLEIKQYAKERSLDPALIAAVIYEESRFESDRESNKGAKGLMQIKQDTGADLARGQKIQNFNDQSLFDPTLNINLGTYLLHDLYFRKYNQNLDLTLAAYNAGSGYVDKQQSQGKGIEIKETLKYMKDVQQTEKIYATVYTTELGLPKKNISAFEMWKISFRALRDNLNAGETN